MIGRTSLGYQAFPIRIRREWLETRVVSRGSPPGTPRAVVLWDIFMGVRTGQPARGEARCQTRIQQTPVSELHRHHIQYHGRGGGV